MQPIHPIRRLRTAAPAGPSASTGTDIVTSLLGVLLLVLMGILLTCSLAGAAIQGADPARRPVVAADPDDPLDHFRSRAFPDSLSHASRALYLDVTCDQVVIHPEGIRVARRELARTGNPVERCLAALAANPGARYPVLHVRPGGAATARELRERIRALGLPVGVDLVESSR